MFERFTDRARRVINLSQEQAQLLNHDVIGTEHLLLAILDEGESKVAQVLAFHGLTYEAALESVRMITGAPEKRSSTGSQPFTPKAKKVLENSFRESLRLGHSYIGVEHILLGLTRDDHRTNDSNALAVLLDGHIGRDELYSAVLAHLEGLRLAELGQLVVYADRAYLVAFRSWLIEETVDGADGFPEGHPVRRMLSAIDTALKPHTPS